ncbi:MAG: MFS transporter [Betaproteobacteria bacterium]
MQPRTATTTADFRWLAGLCTARILFSLIFVAYAAILPLLQAAWHMTSREAGLVQSGWHVGYVVSLFGGGLLIDRFGASRTFLGMSVAGCFATLAFAALAHDSLSGLLLYTLAGVFAGGAYTPVLALIAQRFAPATRGRAMGWYLAAGSLGYAVGLAASGPLVALGGWRFSLLVSACGAIVATLMAFALMRGSHDRPRAEHAAQAQLSRLVEVLRNRPAMLAIGAYTFHSWELLGMWAWIPAFLAAAAAKGGSMDASVVGFGALLAALTHLISMAGSLLGGRWSDRFGRTAVMIGMAVTSLACSALFGWLVGAPLWFLVLVAMVFNLSAIGDSPVYSTALTELVPARVLGSAYAIRSVMGFGVGAVSPWFFGAVLDLTRAYGLSDTIAWGLAWSTLAIGALPGPVMSWMLRRSHEARAMAEGKR